MKLRVIVEYDSDVASFAVFCPELPGCASAGDTEEEALENITEAIALYLEPSEVTIRPGSKVYEVELQV